MCAQSSIQTSFWFRQPMLYLYALSLGLLAGMDYIPWLQTPGIIVSGIFVKIFQCVALPVIALSVLVTLTQHRDNEGVKSVAATTMRYTLSTTMIAASIAFLLYLFIHPHLAYLPQDAVVSHAGKSYIEHLMDLVPDNFLSPFINQQIITALLLSILVAFAINRIPDADSRNTVRLFFKGLHGILMIIVSWIVKIIPLGLFGFVTTTIINLHSGQALMNLGGYLLVVVMANLIQGLVVLPLWLKWHGVNPYKAMKAMMPALSVAFFSKSSVGTLPITIKTIESGLGVHKETSRLVLPLCTTINMNGCAAFIFTTVIFVMQSHGTIITIPMMLLWILIATVAAIGNAGVPMGCYFLSMSLLAGMNVPLSIMGIILPFYALIDMLETALNVWSDICVTKVVDIKGSLTAQSPAKLF